MKNSTQKIICTLTLKRFLALTLFVLGFGTAGYSQVLCQASFTTAVSGSQVTLTNTSVNTTTNTTYYWSWSGPGGWGTSTQQSPVFNFTYNGTYYLYLQITDSLANCQSYVQDSVVITGGQPCQVSFTYTVGANGHVDFTNTSVGNVAYDFYLGDGNSVVGVLPGGTFFHNYTYNGNYTVYTWSDTTGGYCGGYAQAVININNAQACNVNTGFTYTNNGNGIYIFTDTVTTNPPTAIHAWYVNGTYVGAGNPFTIPFNMNGGYTVCDAVTDSTGTGCSDSTCVSITVGGMLCNDSAFFYLYPDSSQAGVWDAYLYAMNGNYPYNAVWSWGDGTSSTGLYPSHNYGTPGWYNICVKAYFACGDSSTYCEIDSVYRTSAQMVTINVINGSNGIHTNSYNMTSLKAYPNPFSEDLTLNFTSYETKQLTYTLFDMMGNAVMKQNVNVHKGDNEIKIHTGSVDKGIYFLNLGGTDGTKTSTLKVVK